VSIPGWDLPSAYHSRHHLFALGHQIVDIYPSAITVAQLIQLTLMRERLDEAASLGQDAEACGKSDKETDHLIAELKMMRFLPHRRRFL
jgi:hypothetical protein